MRNKPRCGDSESRRVAERCPNGVIMSAWGRTVTPSVKTGTAVCTQCLDLDREARAAVDRVWHNYIQINEMRYS